MYRVGVVAIWRMRADDGLAKLPVPKKFEDLKNHDYKIAVLQHALPNLIANGRLDRDDETLILCDSDDEAKDRLLLTGIREPAHIFICNAIMAEQIVRENPKALQLLFANQNNYIDYEQAAIAVRPDWSAMLPAINETMQFLMKSAGLQDKMIASFDKKSREYISMI